MHVVQSVLWSAAVVAASSSLEGASFASASELAVQPSASYPPITVDTTIPEYVRSLRIGAKVETHYVTTNDGYILTTFRIPAKTQTGSSSPPSSNASDMGMDNSAPRVVYFQHGILASAWCWLVNTDGLAPAISLWEQGHDVWLGNSRGNTFGLNHTSIKVHSKEFWNYTFEEMAEHDVPATVDYIITHTQSEGFFRDNEPAQLQYIGWSQGTTAMFIGGVSARPYTSLAGDVTTVSSFLEANVAHLIALSPVVYLEHTTSGLLKFMSETGVGALAEVRLLFHHPCYYSCSIGLGFLFLFPVCLLNFRVGIIF